MEQIHNLQCHLWVHVLIINLKCQLWVICVLIIWHSASPYMCQYFEIAKSHCMCAKNWNKIIWDVTNVVQTIETLFLRVYLTTHWWMWSRCPSCLLKAETEATAAAAAADLSLMDHNLHAYVETCSQSSLTLFCTAALSHFFHLHDVGFYPPNISGEHLCKRVALVMYIFGQLFINLVSLAIHCNTGKRKISRFWCTLYTHFWWWINQHLFIK